MKINIDRIPINKENLSFIITICLVLNWIPQLILGDETKLANITTILAIGFIFIIFYDSASKYYYQAKIFFILILISLAFLSGMLGGIILNNIPFRFLISFLPNIIIIFYYSQSMEISTKRLIVIALIIGSCITCLAVVLAGMGFLPLVYESSYMGDGLKLERKWGGVPSSLLGSYVALMISSINGVIKLKKLINKIVYYTFILFLILYAFQITSQRSLALIILGSLFLMPIINLYFFKDTKYFKTKLKNLLLMFLIFLFLVFVILYFQLFNNLFTLKYRFMAMKEDPVYYGGAQRLEMWKILIDNLITKPSLFAPGDSILFSEVDAGPHFILGEAYYYGGLLSLFGILIIIITSFNMFIRNIKLKYQFQEMYDYNWFIISSLFSILVYLTVMPGFFSRIPFILIGLSLSSLKSNNKI